MSLASVPARDTAHVPTKVREPYTAGEGVCQLWAVASGQELGPWHLMLW